MKDKFYLVLILAFILAASLAQAQMDASQQRRYVVNWTAAPPVLDGNIAPEEWAQASPPQGGFRLLGSGAPAPHEYALQALWDETNLYVSLKCNDKDVPSQQGYPADDFSDSFPGFVFKGSVYEDVEFIFDPGNLEDNIFNESSGDSYQIAVQLVEGMRHAGAVQPPYLFTAARYNSLNGGTSWNPKDIAVGVSLKDGISVEIAIPFSNLNQKYGAFLNANQGETDLELTEIPRNGNQWAFQAARFNNDETCPVWNYHPGNSITMHPYGIFVFAGRPEGASSIFANQQTTAAVPIAPTPASTVASPFVKASGAAPGVSTQTGIVTPIPPMPVPKAIESAQPAAPASPAPMGASPFALPPQAPAVGQPPLDLAAPAAPAVSAPTMGQPPLETTPQTSPFQQSQPPITGAVPFVSVPAASASSTSQIYESLEAGQKAIAQSKLHGVVFFTNMRDEADQRIGRILEQPRFKAELERLIFIRLDADRQRQAMSSFGFYKSPSIVLINSDGSIRKKIQSVSDVDALYLDLQNMK